MNSRGMLLLNIALVVVMVARFMMTGRAFPLILALIYGGLIIVRLQR